MKRYALFAGIDYYASGGWNDFICYGDSIDELRPTEAPRGDPNGHFFVKGIRKAQEWFQIVDLETGSIVHHSGSPYGGDDGALAEERRPPHAWEV